MVYINLSWWLGLELSVAYNQAVVTEILSWMGWLIGISNKAHKRKGQTLLPPLFYLPPPLVSGACMT